jgi:Ca2+/Na+ antiporter
MRRFRKAEAWVAIIIASGIGIARTADSLSRVTGLGQLLGGALLLAVPTSLPDLLVGISAARNGWVDLAVGDLLGAALINMLVLAGLDMLHPSRGRTLSRAAAAHALSGTMSMTLLALVGIAVFIPDRISVSIGVIELTEATKKQIISGGVCEHSTFRFDKMSCLNLRCN